MKMLAGHHITYALLHILAQLRFFLNVALTSINLLSQNNITISVTQTNV